MKIEIKNNNKNKINEIMSELNTNSDCANVLLNRDLNDQLMYVIGNDDYYDLLPNDSIKNIPEAAKVIDKYLRNDKATIYIYGDYDNDGIQSTFIAYDCLTALAEAIKNKYNLKDKCKIEYHVPEREEGYGLSADWCFDIVHNDIDNNNILVITVDNGIAKRYEIDYLQANNIEVIVTDHHCPQEDLIPNCIIVDELLDNDNEYMGICGAGVIYKLCSYLLVDYYGDDSRYNEMYLPNVMTATISDMVPVSLENSIFIRNGLQLLNDKDCICSSSFEHYMNFRGYRKVLPKDIAFEYGPQINACGRMGEANTAIEFLLRDTNLTDIYNQVVILNEERKQKTKDLFIEALPQINENNLVHIIVSNDAGGCAGLLANKIMTEYNRPAIVFTKHKNMYSGSARSIEGLDLQNIFHHLKLQNYITSFGGHESACGVELTEEQFKDFQDIMNSVIYNILLANSNVEVKESPYIIDKILKAKEINNKTLELYKDLLFYGTLNPPKFYIDNVEIDDVIHSTNNENNIKFYFKDESGKSNAWCWGFGETYEKLGSPKKVNIVFELEPFFNGQVVIKIDEMEAAI